MKNVTKTIPENHLNIYIINIKSIPYKYEIYTDEIMKIALLQGFGQFEIKICFYNYRNYYVLCGIYFEEK